MNINLKKTTFQVDVGENLEAWEYINTGLWEPHSFTIFNTFIKENATVIDIGAWSGVLSLYAAHKAKKVYALDPDPICFKELETNIKLNPKLTDKISAHNIAISNKRETVYLHAREAYGKSSSSILSRKRDKKNSFQIKTITLLDFIEQQQIETIDFIKMDVEGAEFKILPNIKHALQKLNYPTLYISFHYNYLNEHLYSKYLTSKLLNKVILKLEKIFGLSLFKRKIKTQLHHSFDAVLKYDYIYTNHGDLIKKEYLKQNPEYIKNHDLVFTNTLWNKS